MAHGSGQLARGERVNQIFWQQLQQVFRRLEGHPVDNFKQAVLLGRPALAARVFLEYRVAHFFLAREQNFEREVGAEHYPGDIDQLRKDLGHTPALGRLSAPGRLRLTGKRVRIHFSSGTG